MERWLKTGSVIRKPKKTVEKSYPDCCGDDWCLNGPPHVLADTYFLCNGCSRKAAKGGINTSQWLTRLRFDNKRIRADRQPVYSNDGNLASNLQNSRPKLTNREMEDFVEEHRDDYYNLDWRLMGRYFQWKACMDEPVPDTRVVYRKGRREDLARWSRFLNKKDSL